MKKIFSVLSAATLVVMMAACGNKQAECTDTCCAHDTMIEDTCCGHDTIAEDTAAAVVVEEPAAEPAKTTTKVTNTVKKEADKVLEEVKEETKSTPSKDIRTVDKPVIII